MTLVPIGVTFYFPIYITPLDQVVISFVLCDLYTIIKAFGYGMNTCMYV